MSESEDWLSLSAASCGRGSFANQLPFRFSTVNGLKPIRIARCLPEFCNTRIPNSRNILFLRKHLSGGTLIDIGANVGDPHFPVSLVKIDVEGHENSVLRGMQKFVAEKRPPLVMFEYLQRTNLEETLRFFARVGYQVFELGTSGPVAATNRVAPLQDLFACPLERMPAIGVGNPTS